MKNLKRTCCLLLALLLMLACAAAFPAAARAEGARLRMYNVWGIKCPACLAELEDLGEISRKYQGLVEVIGLQTGAYGEAELSEGRRILDANGCAYQNLPLTAEYNDMIIVHDEVFFNIPQTHFFDRSGKQVFSVEGGRSFDEFVEIIENLLSAQPEEPALLPGDADNNGRVDIDDLRCLVDFLIDHSKQPASMANADADGSGAVDQEDLLPLIESILGTSY